MNVNLNSFYLKRKNIFDKVEQTTTLKKIVLSLFMACFTGLMAQLIIVLPWTPVPITLQTFAVLVTGLFLGKKWGVFSQSIYVLIGVLGVPWFGGMTGGIGVLLGATGGYLIGFIISTYFIGYMRESNPKYRDFKPMLGIMFIANFLLIYIPGVAILGASIYFAKGSFPSIIELLIMGVVPFIFGDILKILGATVTSKVLLPKN